MLRKVVNRFELDLLARKASALGVGEEVLRKEMMKGGRRDATIQLPHTHQADRSIFHGEALSEAEIGIVAVALARDDLREKILREAPTRDFSNASLAAALGEICHSQKGHGEIESWLAEHLPDEQRSRLSSLMVRPWMDDPKEASKLLDGYLGAIERARHQREIDGHRRGATPADTRESVAAAQSLIAVRREEHRSD